MRPDHWRLSPILIFISLPWPCALLCKCLNPFSNRDWTWASFDWLTGFRWSCVGENRIFIGPHHLVGDCEGIKSISTMPLSAIVPAKLVVDHDRRCIEHIHIWRWSYLYWPRIIRFVRLWFPPRAFIPRILPWEFCDRVEYLFPSVLYVLSCNLSTQR